MNQDTFHVYNGVGHRAALWLGIAYHRWTIAYVPIGLVPHDGNQPNRAWLCLSSP
jgi:hypothetical protein